MTPRDQSTQPASFLMIGEEFTSNISSQEERENGLKRIKDRYLILITRVKSSRLLTLVEMLEARPRRMKNDS